jgi:hypothetical protein
MSPGEAELKVEVGISIEELVGALRAMEEEDREWFLENLLAATSPEYLASIQEARQDYREGRVITAEELFKEQP